MEERARAGEQEEAAAAPHAAKAPLAALAPVTPAVLQNPLNPAVLLPRHLPYVHFDPHVLAEQCAQLETQEEWEWQEEGPQEAAAEVARRGHSQKGHRTLRSPDRVKWQELPHPLYLLLDLTHLSQHNTSTGS